MDPFFFCLSVLEGPHLLTKKPILLTGVSAWTQVCVLGSTIFSVTPFSVTPFSVTPFSVAPLLTIVKLE